MDRRWYGWQGVAAAVVVWVVLAALAPELLAALGSLFRWGGV